VFRRSSLKNKIMNECFFYDFVSQNHKKSTHSKYFLVPSGEKGLFTPASLK